MDPVSCRVFNEGNDLHHTVSYLVATVHHTHVHHQGGLEDVNKLPSRLGLYIFNEEAKMIYFLNKM